MEQNWDLTYRDKHDELITRMITVTSPSYLLHAAAPYVVKGREGFTLEKSLDPNIFYILDPSGWEIATLIRVN